MKKFKDLEFKDRNDGLTGEYACIEFENGYGASVLIGSRFCSNGVDTYEVAVLFKGDLCYSTAVTSDILGYKTKDEVTKILKQIQELGA